MELVAVNEREKTVAAESFCCGRFAWIQVSPYIVSEHSAGGRGGPAFPPVPPDMSYQLPEMIGIKIKQTGKRRTLWNLK